jgi:hypothetical protein
MVHGQSPIEDKHIHLKCLFVITIDNDLIDHTYVVM